MSKYVDILTNLVIETSDFNADFLKKIDNSQRVMEEFIYLKVYLLYPLCFKGLGLGSSEAQKILMETVRKVGSIINSRNISGCTIDKMSKSVDDYKSGGVDKLLEYDEIAVKFVLHVDDINGNDKADESIKMLSPIWGVLMSGDLSKFISMLYIYMQAECSKEKKSSGGCYIATCVYGSYDCPNVWVLRRFRDEVLAENSIGRVFITLYYAVSPKLVTYFGSYQPIRAIWKYPLNKLVEYLMNRGFSDKPYFDK